jgi:hypothetical protein
LAERGNVIAVVEVRHGAPAEVPSFDGCRVDAGAPRDRSRRDLTVMVSLRMIAVYLLARLPDLLDNEKVVFGLDNPFDARLFMSRDDDEVVALSNDGRVAGGRNLDPLDTATTTALTVEG